MKRRSGPVALACVGLAVSACTASSSAARSSGPLSRQSSTPSLTVPTTPPTTLSTATIPSPAAACPPGCGYPSSFDAITVLASSATLVAIVTVNSLGDPSGSTGANVSVDNVLQGNPNDNVYPPTTAELPRLLADARAGTGKSYLIFTSFNRGGACVSALFAYQRATQVATFISLWDGPGPGGQIPLPGRVATIPAAIDLATLRTRMYPTGAITYPVGTAEWFCPGP